MTITELLALTGLRPTPAWLDAYGPELRHACRMHARCAAGACPPDCARQVPVLRTDPHDPDGLRLVYHDCPRKAAAIAERVPRSEAEAIVATLERFFDERYRQEQRRLIADELSRWTMRLLADVADRAMHAFRRLPTLDELHRMAAAERQRAAQEQIRDTPTLPECAARATTAQARGWFRLIGQMLGGHIPRDEQLAAIAEQAQAHREDAAASRPGRA